MHLPMATKITQEILDYNQTKEAEDRVICEVLAHEISKYCLKQKTKSGMHTRFGFWMATP
ncbi:MAG: hypothetical protein BroJett042_08140 [Bacteroidota bacterium]|nr:MAG: hypothetical protein BroJett042_08140 [Bacteroidota bacterium]